MILFPAIDLWENRAVRLLHGDYTKMTVYSDDPLRTALDFRSCGATHIHLVDLAGAKNGDTPHLPLIRKIKKETGLFVEVGGGIRSKEALDRYMDAGIDRAIIGTAAVTDPAFLSCALEEYGAGIAVGVDIKDGFVAVKGWTESSSRRAFDFFAELEKAGVETVICTDISRDGAMRGANRALYGELSTRTGMALIASGGVSSIDDLLALKALGLYGAIVGKAYYTGAIDLKKALEAAK